MTHIFAERGEGSSKESLSSAINDALSNALKDHNFNGDHQCFLSLVITGYHFDGKKYRVKLRVLIFDYELAQEDLYHQLEEQRSDTLKLQENHMNQFYAAVYYTHLYHSGMDNMLNMLKGSIETYNSGFDLRSVTIVSTEAFHNYLAQEFGVQPTLVPVTPPHVDLPDPALDKAS